MAILEAAIARRLGALSLQADLVFDSGVTAIVGPSGSGKTTLLRCLAGLERPDGGRIALGSEVWFDAQAGRSLSVQARRVGFVFGDYALFPHLTVRQNVAFGASAPHRVEAELERLGIAALGDRSARHLSAGEQQRVAIARALAAEPRILLMDEPFSSLDPHLKARVYAEFAALQRALALPVVLVTHDLHEACLLASQVVVLHEGRILQVGTPRDILYRPVSPEVAYLAGNPNVHPAAVAPGGRLAWGDVSLEVSGPLPLVATSLTWCIRAEQVELALGPEAHAVRAVIGAKGLLGHGFRLTCEVPGAGSLQAVLPLAQGEGLEVGDSVWLRLPPEAVHVMEEPVGRLAER